MSILSEIQTSLKAPKNQFNKFGNYKYRSCEDILEGLKPHLGTHKCSVVITDEIEYIGDRFYVKATAYLIDCDNNAIHTASGYARESENKKGMDAAQITGAASSYARKYALNGLFCIDDTKDDDSRPPSDNKSQKEEELRKPLIEQANKVFNQLVNASPQTVAWIGNISVKTNQQITDFITQANEQIKKQGTK